MSFSVNSITHVLVYLLYHIFFGSPPSIPVCLLFLLLSVMFLSAILSVCLPVCLHDYFYILGLCHASVANLILSVPLSKPPFPLQSSVSLPLLPAILPRLFFLYLFFIQCLVFPSPLLLVSPVTDIPTVPTIPKSARASLCSHPGLSTLQFFFPSHLEIYLHCPLCLLLKESCRVYKSACRSSILS